MKDRESRKRAGIPRDSSKARLPALRGFYLYGDRCSGRIWGLRNAGGLWENFLLLDSDITITTFGLDEAGELFVTDYAGGRIYRVIVP